MKLILPLAFASILALPAFAAESGSGVRGGGHVVDVDSNPYLMDLVSRSVCDWKKGEELLTELPQLKATISKLEKLDWYFAADFEKDLSSLNFCMTGPLYKVSPYDWGSITKPVQEDRPRQAGYRLYDKAYIDSEIFERMDDVNQAMLIAHEAMHSYFLMNTYERSLKLRSMVKTLDNVRAGKIVTREKLHYHMQMNEVMFPLTVAQLDPRKETVKFLTGTIQERRAAILKTARPETFLDLAPAQIMALTPWDRFFFQYSWQRAGILADAVVFTMKDLEPEVLSAFIDRKEFKILNPVKLAFSELYSFSPEQIEVILASKRMATLLDSGFDELNKVKFEVKDYLLLAPVEFQKLTSDSAEEVKAVVSLKSNKRLSRSLMWLVETIIILNQNGELEKITKNGDFYSALGLKNQKAQVLATEVKIEREKKVAMEVLNNLSSDMINNLLIELEGRVSVEEYKKIVSQINFNNF